MTAGASAKRLATVLLVALAGCSTAPKSPPVPSPAPSPAQPAPRSGGYYQNDGPPDKVPADILATPDAVPRIEPFHTGAARPYVALGRSFTPITDDRPLVQRGRASWYGRQFHGNRTSTGEIYDMFAMTAAHPTMPLPSYAQVTNLRSGASVVVRVNDRGPFHDGRVIDLSYAAAMRLGVVGNGTAEVEVRRLTHVEIAAASAPQIAAAAAAPVAGPPPADVAGDRRWSVQLGAFSAPDKAQAMLARLQSELATPKAQELPAGLAPRIERDGGLHRVLLGALSERDAAHALAARLAALLGGDIVTWVVLR